MLRLWQRPCQRFMQDFACGGVTVGDYRNWKCAIYLLPLPSFYTAVNKGVLMKHSSVRIFSGQSRIEEARELSQHSSPPLPAQ